MEFNLQFRLTSEEFADFNVYTAWLAPGQKQLRTKTFFTTLFYLLGFSALGVFIARQLSPASKGRPLADPVLIALTLGVGIIGTWITYNRVAARTRAKAIQLVEKEENNHILSEAEMEFREGGFTHTDNKSKTSQAWSSITRYVEENNCFYLYISSMQAFIIPKRVWGEQQEIESFKKFLDEKIPLSSSFRSIGI